MTSYIDLPDMAARYVEAAGYEGVTLRKLDQMTGKSGIVVRRVPSSLTGRYYDGAREVAYVYQVVVRQRSEVRAMQLAAELADLLDGAEIRSGNGSYEFVAQEVYTLPQSLEAGEEGFYAQEFRLKALIETRGSNHGNRDQLPS